MPVGGCAQCRWLQIRVLEDENHRLRAEALAMHTQVVIATAPAVPCRAVSCMRAQSFDHVLRGLLYDRNFLIVMGSSAAILISCVLGRSSKNFGTNGTSRWQVKLMRRSIASGRTSR